MSNQVFVVKQDVYIFGSYFTNIEDAHRFARKEEMPEPVSQWVVRLFESGSVRA